MKPMHAVMAVLVTMIWGFNFPVSKLVLREFSPLLAMTLRYALVALVLVPFAKVPRGNWRGIFLYALVLGGIHFPIVFYGLKGLDASTAAIAIQTQVPLASLLAALLLGDKLGWRRGVGMALAFAGVGVMAGAPGGNVSLPHLGLVLFGALCFAYSNIQIKQMGNIDAYTLTGWMGLLSVPMLLAECFLFERDQWQQIEQASWLGWGSMLYMALFSTIAAYALWQPLMRRFAMNQVMPFTLLVPIFGVTSSVLVMGDRLTVGLVLGGVLTVAGVAVILIRRPTTYEPRTTT